MGSKKSLLITGSAGFIGHHLFERFSNLGFNIVGLDNLNDYYDPDLKKARLTAQGFDVLDLREDELIINKANSDLKFLFADIQNKDLLNEIFEKFQFDYVFHLAAQAGVRYSVTHPQKYIDSNITGYLNILECSRVFKIKHLIYASSSSIYGDEKKIPFNESFDSSTPLSLYAATKKSNELMAYVYSSMHKLSVTGLRFFTVYGPWARPDMALHLFTSAIFQNESINIYNEGNLQRDFTYVDDIVQAMKLLFDDIENISENNPTSSEGQYNLYNIGSGRPTALMDYVKAIEKATGIEAKKNYLPMQMGDMYKTFSDCDSLFDRINFKPSTDLNEGIENFVEWYKSYYSID